MAIIIKRPGGIKLLLQAANAPAYPPPTVPAMNVDVYFHYVGDAKSPSYLGTFPIGNQVEIPFAMDLDRDVVVRAVGRGPLGQQHVSDLRDAPTIIAQSEREQRKPVIGLIRDATNLLADIGVGYYPRHMKARRIKVASDAGFTSIIATYYEDVDKTSAETPRLPEVFRLVRAVPGFGTATYYVKVAHSSFSTVLRTEATQQLKLEALRWGPDSDPLTVTFADANESGGSTGTFNPYVATMDGFGGAPSTFALTVPLPGDISGAVTGTSNGFTDRVALWKTSTQIDYNLPIRVDRSHGYLKANGFTGTVGAINVKTDYLASGSDYQTTGTINAGTNQLTLPSSGHDFIVGQGISVAGAGAAGATLYTTVQSISANLLVLTLNANASTSVVSALVRHDDTVALASAFTAAQSTGRALFFPAGTYWTDTIQPTNYYWRIYGEGPGRSVLRARAANRHVIEITGQPAHTITIEELSIVGAGQTSGASGHGIYIHDNAFDAFNVVLRNLIVTDCGGRGIFIPQHFTTLLERVYCSTNGDNGIELQGNNTCRLASCYVEGVPTGKAGYRVYNGHPLFEACNGVDSGGSWGIFGKNTADDGSDQFCFPVFLCCNVEGFGLGQNLVDGIRIKNGFGHFLSTTFFAGATGTNLRALRVDFMDPAWAMIIDAGCQFYAPGGSSQWSNSQPVHSNGAPFIQLGSLITQYYDTGASAVRSLPTIKSNLIAGSSNIATILSRAQIGALEASSLVGDLSGGVDYAGNAARYLVKGGTVGRPAVADVDNTGTGFSFTATQVAVSFAGAGKYYFTSTYSQFNAPIGINTIPGAGYSLHSTSGGALIVAASGATIPTMELRGGTNPHLFVNDNTNNITARLGTLAGAPDRAFAGTMTNHPFGLFVNGAEAWTVNTTGHLTPQGAYDVGTASLPIRDLNLSRNIVFPSGVRQTFAPNATNAGFNSGTLAGDPSAPSNGDVWYNSTTGKMRTREGGVTKDLVATATGNITGTLVAGRVVLANGTNAITDSANLTFDLTSLIASRAGGNPNFQAVDTTNSITARIGTLAGGPDRGFAGTMTNHPFGLWVNGAEKWTVTTSGHFAPGSANALDLGTASLPIRDLNLGRNIVFPSGVRQTFAPDGTSAGFNSGTLAGDPSTPSNGDVWYNSTTGKMRTREGGVTKDMVSAGSITSVQGTTDQIVASTVSGVVTVAAADLLNAAAAMALFNTCV